MEPVVAAPVPAAFSTVNPAPNAAAPPAVDPALNTAAPRVVYPAPYAAVVHASFNPAPNSSAAAAYFDPVDPAPNAAAPPAVNPALNAAIVHAAFNPAPDASAAAAFFHPVNPVPNAALLQALPVDPVFPEASPHSTDFVAINPAPNTADHAFFHSLPDDPLIHDASFPPADFVAAAPPAPNTANDDDLVSGFAPLFHELASLVLTASTAAPFAASVPAFEDSIIPPFFPEPLTTSNTPAWADPCPAPAASEENIERDRNFASNEQMYNDSNKLKCTSCDLEFDSSEEWLQHVSDNVGHL